MQNKVINQMPFKFNAETLVQTYKWTPNENKEPFDWKCCVCGKITTITKVSNSTFECNNCSNKLNIINVPT